jgi:hypothetical protein
MRHADPRTTMRHDMAKANLDRHAAHAVAAYVAGMSTGSHHHWPTGEPALFDARDLAYCRYGRVTRRNSRTASLNCPGASEIAEMTCPQQHDQGRPQDLRMQTFGDGERSSRITVAVHEQCWHIHMGE